MTTPHDDGTRRCLLVVCLLICLVSCCKSCSTDTSVKQLRCDVKGVTEEVEFLGTVLEELTTSE